MLIEFTVANFRSFREKYTLSLQAATDKWLEDDNVGHVGGYRLLKTAAIYGPNAGGKSNLMMAMRHMRQWVLGSSKEGQAGEKIPVSPFRLNTKTESAPSFFEVMFVVGQTRYRYGFEADAERVRTEWLLSRADSTRETTLFTRDGETITPGAEFREGNGLEERTRPNALFLSVVAQFNGRIAGEVVVWFDHFRAISGLNDDGYIGFTAELLRNDTMRQQIVELMHKADVGIEDLRSRQVSPEKLSAIIPPNLPKSLRAQFLKAAEQAFELKTFHRKFDGDKPMEGLVEFDLAMDESAGTAKYLGLLGPFLDTLSEGSVLLVDELEARLHPRLTKALVGLFNSSANRKNAQLVFATHDAGLLDARTVRRDQVWFVEKDPQGASSLYPLTDFKIRKEAKIGKEYLLGQFGGVPHIGDMRETLLHATE
ncbi:MAG: AAA family ATPase [Opitutaceae bacterium]|nr:AAA family ATPase [Opitutaceae bacterium]